jgi:hypothetical protein
MIFTTFEQNIGIKYALYQQELRLYNEIKFKTPARFFRS